MDIRIALTCPTVNALQERLPNTYARGDVRLVRRISALLEDFVQQTPLPELSGRWGFSLACAYDWVNAFLVQGLDSLVYSHAGGRPSRRTPTQKQRLCELVDAGPPFAIT